MKPVSGLSLTTTPSKRDHNTLTWLMKARLKLVPSPLRLAFYF